MTSFPVGTEIGCVGATKFLVSDTLMKSFPVGTEIGCVGVTSFPVSDTLVTSFPVGTEIGCVGLTSFPVSDTLVTSFPVGSEYTSPMVSCGFLVMFLLPWLGVHLLQISQWYQINIVFD